MWVTKNLKSSTRLLTEKPQMMTLDGMEENSPSGFQYKAGDVREWRSGHD